MITVVCWKWDNGEHPKKRLRFSARHVNILRASVERNLKQSHEFVCVTDDWRGLHSSVRVVDINKHFPQIPGFQGGCWRRLKAFDYCTSSSLFGERFVSLDLDVVVTGGLDGLFGFKDDFRIWEDTYRRRTPYCGSLWGMYSGFRQEVWDRFEEDPNAAIGEARERKYMGTDQAIISSVLWPQERVWSREDGIYNFNTQIRRSALLFHRGSDGGLYMRQQADGSLPRECRLVFFNGKFDPSQPELQRGHSWIGDYWHE